jgi:hypothetical protein
MAGEAIRDKNFDARSRLSNDPEEAKRRAGLVDDKYDVSGFSDKEISMALMGSSFGDEDYARLTGKSMGSDDSNSDAGGSEDNSSSSPGPTPGITPSPSPEEPVNITPIPGLGGNYGNSGQSQNVYQDNDITNTINGDNNEVSNFQDNSISQSMGSSDYQSRYARGLKDQYVLNLLNR